MYPNILDSIDPEEILSFKSFTDRYFSKRYVLDINGIKNNDIMLMFHSNRMVLLSLAPSHFFFKKTGEYNINFSIGNVDRLSNVVTGKGKKGGQILNPKSTICIIEYNDGTSFEVPCCMKGKLVEVNEQLVKNPELLRQYPDADGFIAIMLSSIAITDATKNELLTPEDYLKALNDTPCTTY